MSAECHYSNCRWHPRDEPFCHESECRAMKGYCPLCGVKITEDNAAMFDGKLRFDALGYLWCKTCTDEFDNIEL